MLDLLQPVAEKLNKRRRCIFFNSKSSKHVTKKNLDDKLPSVVSNATRDTLAKETKNKKGIIDSQPTEKHNVLTQHPEDPSCSLQEDNVISTPHLARITRANFSSRVARMSCFAPSMIHFCSTLSTPTSCSLLFPQNWANSCAPPTGLFFGRFAQQSPLAGYKPEHSC